MPSERQRTALDHLFVIGQGLLPQHLLSRALGKLAASEIGWLKNLLINAFIRHYGVDLGEAELQSPAAYASFNAFFSRALKPQARPLEDNPAAVASPVDGTVSQLGRLQHERIIQAKGHDYGLLELLGGDPELARYFVDGDFVTLYLSPRDYHRIHMPVAGTLKAMIYVPGRLYSVNPATTERLPGLFTRNERVICLFDTTSGPMAMVLVGAMIVASIETVWAGLVTLPRRQLHRWRYDQGPIELARGQEMARFLLGSTVILLFGPNQLRWSAELQPGTPLRMGETVANMQK